MGTDREVVVTGIGLITALTPLMPTPREKTTSDCAGNTKEFWEKLCRGHVSLGKITLFDATPYSSDLGAEVRGLVPDQAVSRWQTLLDLAFLDALNDSALDLTKIDKTKAGMVVGTVLGPILEQEGFWRRSHSETNEPTDKYCLHTGAERLSRHYGLRGPVTTVSTACSSGTDAIGLALRAIRSGQTDIMIAGGAETLSELAFSGFSSLHALTGTSVKPFDAARDGLAPGEGAAFVVLEDRAHAKGRGARIYAQVMGYGSSADANHMTAPDREGLGLARTMTAALDEAGLCSVDYINAHGTATAYNDLMEVKAIKRVFGRNASAVPVSAIKGSVGHTFGAAGAIEAVTCLLAMKNNTVPPTIGLTEPDSEFGLDLVFGGPRSVHVDTAISISAGFGGQNGALVFGPCSGEEKAN